MPKDDRERVNLSMTTAELARVDRMLSKSPWKFQKRSAALKSLILYVSENINTVAALVTQRNPTEPNGTQRLPEPEPDQSGTEVALQSPQKEDTREKEKKSAALAPLPVVTEILSLLKKLGGANCRPSAAAHRRLIQARLNEGYTVDDLKTVVRKKCAEWAGGKLATNLKPSCLFRASNFDGYLGQPEGRGQQSLFGASAPEEPKYGVYIDGEGWHHYEGNTLVPGPAPTRKKRS